jgi:tetratricopeptide (TPR) repeat protein
VPSVFLSYAREDAGKARPIALALEKAGHTVWWDPHVRGGAQFSKVIEKALKAADAVVVLWSEHSVESPWVRDEAAVGRDSGRLVPVSLDGTEPPLGFRQFQTIDLSGWSGRGRLPHRSALVAAIDEVADGGARPPLGAPQSAAPPTADRRRLWASSLAAITVLAVAVALLLWRPWQRRSTPVVAVAAAEPSAGSNALARDLFIQLGRLQSTNPEALHLVLDDPAGAEFLLQVQGSGRAPRPGASLALVDGKNETLLWSKTYEQPSGSLSDLRQQLAYAAASVLECAAQASAAALSDESRKTYLNGCAERAEGGVPAVVRMFETVARAEPHFRGAWAKLLLAESSSAVLSLVTTGSDALIRQSLRRHIAEARKHHGTFAEVLIVEMELLPPGAFAERIRLADAALELEPRNPSALAARADELMSVGRIDEAIQDLERALELDPLSPARHSAYIDFLLSGGRVAAAAEALKKADRLWPGATSVADSKLRFHSAFGDPAVAMRIYRSTGGTSALFEARMLARLDPTAENIERAAAQARALLARSGDVTTYGQVMAALGREEEMFATIATMNDPLPQDSTWVYFTPGLGTFRADPRFIPVARRLGLADYWSASGKWPDFCFEPGLPYDCKSEVAKLTRPAE